MHASKDVTVRASYMCSSAAAVMRFLVTEAIKLYL